jgi:hypothetical protein
MIEFSRGILFEAYFSLQKGIINDEFSGQFALIAKFMEIAKNKEMVKWLHQYCWISCK